MSASPFPRQLAWFIGIWAIGVVAIILVGYAIKLALGA